MQHGLMQLAQPARLWLNMNLHALLSSAGGWCLAAGVQGHMLCAALSSRPTLRTLRASAIEIFLKSTSSPVGVGATVSACPSPSFSFSFCGLSPAPAPLAEFLLAATPFWAVPAGLVLLRCWLAAPLTLGPLELRP